MSDPSASIEQGSVAYAIRLSRITERYLVAVGAAIIAAVLSFMVSVVVIVLVVSVVQDSDAQERRQCDAIETVVRETLIPLNPPPNPTSDQLRSYESASAQRLARLHQATRELGKVGCRLSVQVRTTPTTTTGGAP